VGVYYHMGVDKDACIYIYIHTHTHTHEGVWTEMCMYTHRNGKSLRRPKIQVLHPFIK